MQTPRRSLALALLVFASMAWTSEARAQAWVKPPGQTYLKVSAATFQANGSYDVDGDLEDPPFDYGNTSIGIYGELGIAPDLAVSVNTGFYRAINTVEERTRYINTGPGDLTLGLHYNLWRGSLCTSTGSLKGTFPLYPGIIEPGAEVGGAGVSGAERFTPALGDGSVDIIPAVSFGCGIPAIRGWASASAGYQVRLRGFGDGVLYGANVGSFVWPQRLALTASVSGVQRVTDDAERPTKSYISLGGGTLLRIWGPLSLEASASYIPTGAFVSRGWSASAGLSYSGSLW